MAIARWRRSPAVHDVALTQRWSIGYGARYEHYDYLDGYGLVSPSVKAVFTPVPELRFHARASFQQIAPGAEEFVPAADAQWVPPQRTFAPIGDGRFSTESVLQYELGATRQLRGLSIGVRGFRQAIDDQQVTVFGAGRSGPPDRRRRSLQRGPGRRCPAARLGRPGRACALAVRPRQRGLRAGRDRLGSAVAGQTSAPSPPSRRGRCARPTNGCTT